MSILHNSLSLGLQMLEERFCSENVCWFWTGNLLEVGNMLENDLESCFVLSCDLAELYQWRFVCCRIVHLWLMYFIKLDIIYWNFVNTTCILTIFAIIIWRCYILIWGCSPNGLVGPPLTLCAFTFLIPLTNFTRRKAIKILTDFLWSTSTKP